MRNIRTLLLALGLASLAAPALAQTTCPVIPALPDTERRTEYLGVSGSTGPFNVVFQIYGDSTDYGNWVEVWVNGVKKTAVTDYTVTSPSGAVSALCRPITDAQVTFLAAQTGSVEIVGARRPRRASQVSENRGVTAHDFNQIITDMTAEMRERWDLTARLFRAPPGETLSALPPLASRASSILGFDASGNPSVVAPTIGLGTVIGPASSVDGHVALFDGATGAKIKDGGSLTITPANPTATIGLTAINGVASTIMRSDAAPPLSQAIVPTWTGLHNFNGGWLSNVTQPALQVPFPSFNGDTATPAFFVGTSSILTWTGSLTNGATAINGQSVVTSGSSTAGNAGEVGGVYGGALNQKSGAQPYGVLGVIYNDNNALPTPGGEAGYFIVRGTQVNSQVYGVHVSAESVVGQNPGAGVIVTDLGTHNNEFTNGVQVVSAKGAGFIVGTQLGSCGTGCTVPTLPFAFYASPSVLTWSVNASGQTSGANFFSTVGTDSAAFQSSDGTVTGVLVPSSNNTHSFMIGTSSNHPLLFETNGAVRTNLDTSGNWIWAAYGAGIIQSSASGAITSSGTIPTQTIFSEARTIVSATGAALDDVKVAAATTTVTGSTNITKLAKVGLYQPTFTDASGVSVTQAATLYIDGPPIAAGSLLFGQNANYGLWVNSGGVLFGPSLPNPGSAGLLTLSSGSNPTVIQASSSVSNTSISTYYSGPTFFYQLGSNTANNTQVIDFRSFNASKNSFAGIGAQITDVTDGAVKGKIFLGVANGSGAASLFTYIEPSGCLNVGTDSDCGASSIQANGSIKSISASAGIGYATGSGASVTQGTNRTTGVTINSVTGSITLVSAVGSATPASFTVTNTSIASTDVVLVSQKSGTDLYEIFVTNVTGGSFKITSFTTGGTTTEQPVFSFVVLKGATS